jgi:hypothetical protein
MTVDEWVAKQEIADGLYRYCRSLDRMDPALFATVFTADADLDYGEHFTGTPDGFRQWVWAAHAGMQAHSHQITNILSEVDTTKGQAVSEAYVTVCLRTRPQATGDVVDIVDRGRYLDRWVRADDGGWRIASRRYRSDIQQVVPASAAPPVTSVRDTSDPSFDLFRG